MSHRAAPTFTFGAALPILSGTSAEVTRGALSGPSQLGARTPAQHGQHETGRAREQCRAQAGVHEASFYWYLDFIQAQRSGLEVAWPASA